MTSSRLFTTCIALFAFTLLSPAATTHAQPKRPVIIGYLAVGSQEGTAHFYAAFLEGMKERGWKEGSDYRVEARWADAQSARLEGLAKEIALKNPALVVAAPNNAVTTAARVLPGVPVVQANGGDPIASGHTSSLSKPSGMITGVSNLIGDLSEKNLELLMRAAPGLKRVGFLYEPTPIGITSVAAAKRSIAQYKAQARFASAQNPAELDTALATLANEGAQALVILAGGVFPSERKRILRIAATHRWPVVGGLREYAEEGALVAYGADRTALYRRSAYFVDRILKGAHPRDLPFEQPTKFELVLNAKAAKALGIKLPNELLLRADVVLE